MSETKPSPILGVPPAVKDELPDRCCARCRHFHLMSANQASCRFNPPTPILVGGGQDAMGRMQMHDEYARQALEVIDGYSFDVAQPFGGLFLGRYASQFTSALTSSF